MHQSFAVNVERLRARCRPESLPYADTQSAPTEGGLLVDLQPRAKGALEVALSIPGREYNVFVAGEPGLGRTTFVTRFLAPLAAVRPTPPDLIYLHNFEDDDRPLLLQLSPGQGRELKTLMTKAMGFVREEISSRFEAENFVRERQRLARAYQLAREEIYASMEEHCLSQGFQLEVDDSGGLGLVPVIEGRSLSGEEFDHLEPTFRDSLKAKGEEVLSELSDYLRRIYERERVWRDGEKELEQTTVGAILDEALAPLTEKFAGHQGLAAFFEAVREDVLDELDTIAPKVEHIGAAAQAAAQASPLDAGHPGEDIYLRYEINVFVDNDNTVGAPVVVEDHPTTFNLLGVLERESDYGALVTDHTLIKAGALHRANGGYLILRVDDVASMPTAWEGLLRALRSGLARIEDPFDGAEHVRTRTIEPEPLSFDVKVVLVGVDEVHEALLYGDERFAKLFKVKAHLCDEVARTPEHIDYFLRAVARIVRESGLLPFDQGAMAALVDHASLLADDQDKLSLRLSVTRELLIESDALARAAGREVVDAAHVAAAHKAQIFRANLFAEEYLAEYDREMIKVATSGSAVGRANGLTVREYGGFAFGLPHQIACIVGVGHGGILDLEREAELGGPIHTKGMMILKSYLVGQFARDKPVALTGSLCFEQSYGGVEGDSASGAELAALLSALADVPINMSYAFTGAVSSSGAIMAVGGLNEKIEGFFEVCRRRGLTGQQGVIMPHDNVVNLMLPESVIEAVASGQFHIFAVKRIEEALSILTGLPAGERGADCGYPEGSLYRLVDDRLSRLAELACRYENRFRA